MGRVVGDDAVERAVFEPFDDGKAVSFLADGRVDFGVGIEGGDDFVGQCKVVRAGLRRDLHAARLGLADELHAAVSRDVADMHGDIKALRKADLAGDDDVFRRADAALEPRERREVPLVDDAAVDERLVLAMAEADKPEVGGVLHGVCHEPRAHDGLAVLAERHRARRLHAADGSQLLALLPLGDGADRPHFAQIYVLRAR